MLAHLRGGPLRVTGDDSLVYRSVSSMGDQQVIGSHLARVAQARTSVGVDRSDDRSSEPIARASKNQIVILRIGILVPLGLVEQLLESQLGRRAVRAAVHRS